MPMADDLKTGIVSMIVTAQYSSTLLFVILVDTVDLAANIGCLGCVLPNHGDIVS